MTERAYPPRPTNSDYATNFWKKMDDLFEDTIKQEKITLKGARLINYIVVVVGIVLLIYSIVYSIINNLDVYSVAFGTLGVVTFVATFFFGPQKNIQLVVANMTKIQVLYRAYCLIEDGLADWQRVNPNAQAQDMEKVYKVLIDGVKEIAEKMNPKTD